MSTNKSPLSAIKSGACTSGGGPAFEAKRFRSCSCTSALLLHCAQNHIQCGLCPAPLLLMHPCPS
eukprot:644085-Pelagomonas_calceolata.AAC.1